VNRATCSTPFHLNTGQNPLTIQEVLLSPRSRNVSSVENYIEQMVNRSHLAAKSIYAYNEAMVRNANKSGRDI
jgi:hypothetical protein